ncbi:MAG: hypothetical protein WCC03_07340 [Candidatus Acidiferrales bacterium]
MARNQRIARTAVVVAALLASLFSVGAAWAQGQSPAYVGTFTTTNQIQWDKTVLQPGAYTITIESTGSPIVASIRNAKGNAVTHVVSGAHTGKTNGVNALLIKERNGQLEVHSLALADLGMVLIYDPVLAQEAVREARASKTVPVIWAKK